MMIALRTKNVGDPNFFGMVKLLTAALSQLFVPEAKRSGHFCFIHGPFVPLHLQFDVTQVQRLFQFATNQLSYTEI